MHVRILKQVALQILKQYLINPKGAHLINTILKDQETMFSNPKNLMTCWIFRKKEAPFKS